MRKDFYFLANYEADRSENLLRHIGALDRMKKSTDIIKYSDVDYSIIEPQLDCFIQDSKDYINVCKDCEFRYSCTDSRIPMNINNEWFYESECNYNPYISKWSNEIGYISLSDIGKFNGFIFYPDKNVITKINKELWEKA